MFNWLHCAPIDINILLFRVGGSGQEGKSEDEELHCSIRIFQLRSFKVNFSSFITIHSLINSMKSQEAKLLDKTLPIKNNRNSISEFFGCNFLGYFLHIGGKGDFKLSIQWSKTGPTDEAKSEAKRVYFLRKKNQTFCDERQSKIISSLKLQSKLLSYLDLN